MFVGPAELNHSGGTAAALASKGLTTDELLMLPKGLRELYGDEPDYGGPVADPGTMGEELGDEKMARAAGVLETRATGNGVRKGSHRLRLMIWSRRQRMKWRIGPR